MNLARVGACLGALGSTTACTSDAGTNEETGGSSEEGSSTGGSTSSASAGTTDPTQAEASSDGEVSGTSSDATTGGPTGPFPGCGVDPGLDGPVEASIEVDGVERTYILSLPADYDPLQGYPLVFAFHGRGGNSELFRAYAGVEEAAAGQAIFAYPQGLPLADMGGQTGWDLGIAGTDVRFIEALHEELISNLCIDPERVYATGHSFGGYFSNTLGCAIGDKLRAIAPVSGGGPYGACTGEVAAIVMHGVDDPVVPTPQGEASRDHWVSASGCSDQTTPYDPDPCVAYDGCTEGYEVVWCLYTDSDPGLGTHTWPGFAGATIWSFFESH